MNRALLIVGDPSITPRPARRDAAEELLARATMPFRAGLGASDGSFAVVLSADEEHYPDNAVLALAHWHRMDVRRYGLDGVIRRAIGAEEKRFAPGAVSPGAVVDTMLSALAALRARAWDTRAVALCSVEHDYPECLAQRVVERAAEVHKVAVELLRCEVA